MSLQLSTAITDGLRRTATKTGAVLFGVLLLTQFVVITSVNTMLSTALPAQAPQAPDLVGLTLPVSGNVAGILFLATFLFNIMFFVVLSRAFARPRAQLSTFSSDLYTRRIGRAALSMLITGAIVFIATMIAFPFLIIPGIFVATCFLFSIFAVGVEDRGTIGALKRSWALSRGNRLKLSFIVIFAGVSGGVIGAATTLFQAVGAPVVGDIFSVLLNSILSLLIYGIAASAYLQVVDNEDDFGGMNQSPAGHSEFSPQD